MCGKLEKAMHGTREAAQNWERQYEATFLELGFQQAKVPLVYSIMSIKI